MATLTKEDEMLTLEWIRVTDHKFDRDRSYLVRWGELENFHYHNTKVSHLTSMGNWVIQGEVVKTPDYAFPINSVKHRVVTETFSMGDKVHVDDPKTQHWTGTIVAKRNLSRIWIIRDSAGFGTDVNEKYFSKVSLQIPSTSRHLSNIDKEQ